MRFIWGSVTGAVIGWVGGPLGSAFGLGIGVLVDQIVEGARRRRAYHAFLRDPSFPAPGGHDRAVAAAVGLLAAVGVTSAESQRVDGALRRLKDCLHRGTILGLRTLYRDASAMEKEPALEALASVFADARPIQERERLFAMLVELCPRRRSAAGELSPIADGLGIDPEFAAGLVNPPELLDAAACSILGVEQSASAHEIKRVYRRLAAQFHPDTGRELDEEQRQIAGRAFIRITEAYERLIEELARRGRL